jgi:hypothetical protein
MEISQPTALGEGKVVAYATFCDCAMNYREKKDRHAGVPRALQVASTSSCIGYTDATNSCYR